MTLTMNAEETAMPITSPLKFNLLNASTLYFEELNQVKEAYERSSIALDMEKDTLDDTLKMISKAYQLKGIFNSVITFEPSRGAEKVNQIINILYNSNVEVHGIRLNQDQTTIEMGFSKSEDRYKALLILESVGF